MLAVLGLLGPSAESTGSVRFDGAGAARRRRPACCAGSAGSRHRHDLPGPADVAEPGPHRSVDQLAEAVLAHDPRRASGPSTRAGELLELVSIPDVNRRLRAVPARALRRHAPAGDDRHGARQRSRAADRRRADDRPRRHDPGPDPRRARRRAARARPRRRARHPRPRRGRRAGPPGQRDVRRPDRRGRRRRSACSTARTTRTPAACWPACRASTGATTSIPIGGVAAVARPAPGRLRVPPPLPARRRPLPSPSCRSCACSRRRPRRATSRRWSRRSSSRDAVCEVTDLVKTFDAARSAAASVGRHGAGRLGRVVRGRPRRDAEPGRRVGLRQEHDGALRPAPHRAGQRLDRVRRDRADDAEVARSCGGCGAASRWCSRTRRRRCNPRMTVRELLAEPLRGARDRAARADARGSPSCSTSSSCPASAAARYPHQFSGGQRQRIGIARALAVGPDAARARRAGVGARRQHPGRDHPPPGAAAQRARPRVPVHRPRPVRRPPHQRSRRRDVPRTDRRDRARPTRCTGRSAHPYTPGAAVGGADPRPADRAAAVGASCSKASRRRRPTRRRAAASAPGAGRRPRSCSEVVPELVDPGVGHAVACHHPESVDVVARRDFTTGSIPEPTVRSLP